MIEKVKMRGFRGFDKDIVLTQRTLVVGPNGSGKTSIAAAALLAWNGYIPGEDKRGPEMYASWATAPQMGVGVVVVGADGVAHEVKRGWSDKRGKISEILMVDGKTGGDVSVLGRSPVDLGAIYDLSDRELRKVVMASVGGKEYLDAFTKAVEAEAVAREAMNAARVKARNSEQAVSRLVEEVASAASSMAGNSSQVEAELKSLEAAERDLAASVSAGEENDRLRSKVLPADLVESTKARILEIGAELGRLDADEKGHIDSLDRYDAAARDLTCLSVSEYVSGVVEKALLHIPGDSPAREYLTQFTSEGQDGIREKLCRLSSKSASIKRECVAIEQAVSKLLNERIALDAKLNVAAANVSEIGPGASDEERTRLAGIRERISKLREHGRAAIRRDTLARELEKARLEVERSSRDAEKHADAVKACVDTMKGISSGIASSVVDIMKARLPASIVPEYREVDGKIRIGLMKNGMFVPRAGCGGAERVMLDQAFARTLGGEHGTVFVEASELSDDLLSEFLSGIAHGSDQVVVMRWVNAGADIQIKIPDGWSVCSAGPVEVAK